MTALRNELSDDELARQADKGEPEKGRWSQAEQLLAASYDVLRRIEHVLICANSEKNKQPDPPEPMRRPGAKPKPARAAAQPLTEQRADLLYRLING